MVEKAMRFDGGKIDRSYQLAFPRAMALLCNVCTYGEYKYGRDNYRDGGKGSREYFKCQMRHVQEGFAAMQYPDYADQVFDKESGLHHIGHAIWNLMSVLELEVEDLMRFETQEDFIKHCEEVQEKFRAKREEAQRVTKPDDTPTIKLRGADSEGNYTEVEVPTK